MATKEQIAYALTGGDPRGLDSKGLEIPIEGRLLQNLASIGNGYATATGAGNIAQALLGKGLPALQAMGQAGAIFPKELKPKDILPESERAYKFWEALEKQYLANHDFEAALRAKWGMLKNYAGN